ncbi:hypothetical protein QZH41_003214 [Actinostola sp. cb2023]|nr:hypothetical protein QZH41_003214 [Actinostola sp. cb2023]
MTSNVTSGEGAESDDDSTHAPSFMKNTMVTNTMVSGEASETDEEDEGDDVNKGDPYSSPIEAEEPLPLVDDNAVTLTTTIDEPIDVALLEKKRAKRHKLVYKYDTPFHRKLPHIFGYSKDEILENVFGIVAHYVNERSDL